MRTSVLDQRSMAKMQAVVGADRDRRAAMPSAQIDESPNELHGHRGTGPHKVGIIGDAGTAAHGISFARRRGPRQNTSAEIPVAKADRENRHKVHHRPEYHAER